jgi:hypothetical protein
VIQQKEFCNLPEARELHCNCSCCMLGQSATLSVRLLQFLSARTTDFLKMFFCAKLLCCNMHLASVLLHWADSQSSISILAVCQPVCYHSTVLYNHKSLHPTQLSMCCKQLFVDAQSLCSTCAAVKCSTSARSLPTAALCTTPCANMSQVIDLPKLIP